MGFQVSPCCDAAPKKRDSMEFALQSTQFKNSKQLDTIDKVKRIQLL